jgi:hypothetical protein
MDIVVGEINFSKSSTPPYTYTNNSQFKKFEGYPDYNPIKISNPDILFNNNQPIFPPLLNLKNKYLATLSSSKSSILIYDLTDQNSQ